ncbi:MAG: hypothetical protein PHQ42_04470 [Patescibacteria group bacterium]|nr:hypothetical protein [Patescibacteria group bacterium]
MSGEQKNKVLILGEAPWQQAIIKNALEVIFKTRRKFYIMSGALEDALANLAANQDDLYCAFCYHGNKTSGIEFFKQWKNLGRVKSIPFVLLADVRFANAFEEAEKMGIACVQFPVYPINSHTLAKMIVKAMAERKKKII